MNRTTYDTENVIGIRSLSIFRDRDVRGRTGIGERMGIGERSRKSMQEEEPQCLLLLYGPLCMHITTGSSMTQLGVVIGEGAGKVRSTKTDSVVV